MAKKKKSKKVDNTKAAEQTQDTKEYEQSVWTVKINSQLLYKKAVDGRTILLGMTAEESTKVAEVMGKAIDDLAKVLENKTTQHEAPAKREPVTRFDATKPDNVDEVVEEKENTDSDDVAKPDVTEDTEEAEEEKENT